ncbi:MAG: VCBS repeat-containing protein [Ignavibacteriae bacterium]|nr:VCBS repeat-containing protein [Ignavibacteriota bacterium]
MARQFFLPPLLLTLAFVTSLIGGDKNYTANVFDLHGRFLGTIQTSERVSAVQARALRSEVITSRHERLMNLTDGIYFLAAPGEQITPPSTSQGFGFADVTSTYLPQQEWNAGQLKTADLNGDARDDIVFTRTLIYCDSLSTDTRPRVWIQTPNGSYVDETDSRIPDIFAPSYSLVLFDADGDGDVDMFIGGFSCGDRSLVATLLINNGTGVFTDQSTQRLPSIDPGSYGRFVYFSTALHADSSQSLDLVVNIFGPPDSGGSILTPEIWISSGDGHFLRDTLQRLSYAEEYGFLIPFAGDIDGDSLDDIVFANTELCITVDDPTCIDTLSGRTTIFHNLGNGFFSDETESRMPPQDNRSIRTLAFGDVDQDGDDDLLEVGFPFGEYLYQVRMLHNDGVGYFSVAEDALPHYISGWFNDANFGFLDSDVYPDLFLPRVELGVPSYDFLFVNRGDGTLEDKTSLLPRVLDFTVSSALFDYNRDSTLDIITANAAGIAGLFGQNRLYHNTLGGLPWIKQNSGTTVRLNDVAVVDSMTAIVVGNSGTILKTTDAGQHWIRKESGTVKRLNAVAFSYKERGYIAGDSVLCTTTDGGETWTAEWRPDKLISVAAGIEFCDEVCTGGYSGEVQCAGESRMLDGDPVLSLSVRYGPLQSCIVKALTHQLLYTYWFFWDSIKIPIIIWDVVTGGDLIHYPIYVVGWGGNPGPLPFVLRYDTTWTQLGTGITAPTILNDVSAFWTSPTVYVCGSDGRIFKSTNDGENWTQELTGTTADLRSIAFFNESNGFAVGYSGTILHLSGAAPSSPMIIHVPQDQPTIQSAIAFARDGDTVLVSPGTYRENIDFLGKSITVASQFLTTGDKGYIGQTIIQADSGSVVTFASAEKPVALLTGFTITGGTGTVIGLQVFGGGIFVCGSSPTIHGNIITENILFSCSNRGGGVAIKDSSFPRILANIITDNQIVGPCTWINYFGGGIWVDATSNPIIGGTLSDGNDIYSNVADYIGKQLYRAGSGSVINAQYNYWGGSCPPDSSDVYPLAQFDVSNCLQNPIVNVQENSNLEPQTPNCFVLEQNYPNPFNPMTTLSFELGALSHVSLKIYNVLGEEVVTLVNEVKEQGRYVVNWNPAGVPSGVYFYRIAATGIKPGSSVRFSDVKKMIVLK